MRARRQLTDDDREEVSRGIAEQAEGKVIAARIDRCPSVVSRDIARHGGRATYLAVVAARAAARSRRRPKTPKLDAESALRERERAKLWAGYSPDRVAGRWRYEYSGTEAERVADTVSHEAIYKEPTRPSGTHPFHRPRDRCPSPSAPAGEVAGGSQVSPRRG
ncbi:Helix-turn-helix domain-containing protein [Modestobacter sp. DSM 44400]|uniref:helix-turn-helix domain-containing protein n=1 Tax=Modestobacter sp. DSM 44400 TaxID=1550230 RepID=UPI000897BAC3|nr:helix-turn-helix domain-containing protein [Modestobacter sp. DSM 44400]SDY61681.1 Helix-turn-helix domain-containing protein [Modestobacter sp. DSM 44400]